MNSLKVRAVECCDGRVYLLDQTLLPAREMVMEIETVAAMWEAIKRLSVRGAPAIGVAAAYGVFIAARNAEADGGDVRFAVKEACEYLATSRPTAVNLFWALDRMQSVADHCGEDGDSLVGVLLAEAEQIESGETEACTAIGRYGAELLKDGDCILTHCNAGSLAACGPGTALAPIYQAHEDGKSVSVFADETRPLLQGARLTAWELERNGIPVTVICDNMAASLMRMGRIDKIIVGADRIAANGDTANKIGTYSLAVLAKYHQIPFYVAAPTSTIDQQCQTGEAIPIEERQGSEVRNFMNQATAPDGAAVWNPAFDVTPVGLITGFITEKGLVKNPSEINFVRFS